MSMTERFNYIEFSNRDKFYINPAGRYELKSYSEDLMFYSSYDSTINATYGLGNPSPTTSGTLSIVNFGKFAQHLYLQGNGTTIYDANNFSYLGDQGTLKFWIKTGFNNDTGYQDFLATSGVTPADTNYRFKVYINGTLLGGDSKFVSLLSTDTMALIRNKIDAKVTPTATTSLLAAGNIRMRSGSNGDSISIQSGNTYDLVALLGGMGPSIIPNGPVTDSNFMEFYNGADSKNRITLTHTGDSSHIKLKMYNSSGTLVVNKDFGIWSNHYDEWYSFEFNWSKSLCELFIDGIFKGVATTGFARAADGYLYIRANAADFYRIDEVQVYNTLKHTYDFSADSIALNAYPTDNPYIDIHMGTGFVQGQVADLDLTASPSGTQYCVKVGNSWYYYLSGAWRISDGTFTQSCTPDLVETKFTELTFNPETDLVIRVYFHSDGVTPVWISDINIVTEQGTAGNALITGAIDLRNPVDMTSIYNVVISTDSGSSEVNVSTGAGMVSAVTLAEIKAAINAVGVPGLAQATDDGSGHLVLQSTNTGTDAFVGITAGLTNNALPIMWGYESNSLGTEAIAGDVVDYSELYRYCRSMLGEPTIPVELTDEQLEDCLGDAVYQFNRWRNFKENLLYTHLSGSSHDGYTIPPEVGGAENIMEIVMLPRFPFGFYTGKDDILNNLYVNWLFNNMKSGFNGILSDYYVVLQTELDVNIVMGTQVKWEIMNGKLYIFPKPDDRALNVGIRYRGALTAAQIVTDWWIKRYTLAEAKIVLGNIRSTFKSGVPGGTEMIQLNGEDLKAEGTTEKTELVEEMKKSMEPLPFAIF